MCRTSAVFFLMLGILSALMPREADAAEPDALQKAPAAIIQKIQRGEQQDLLVLFDDAAVQREAADLRSKRGLKTDSDEIQAVKADRYKTLRQSVLAALPQGQHALLLGYSHLPMAFIRFRTPGALQTLLQRPDVIAVYPDEKKYTQLSQSLPMISQPLVSAAGDSGNGTTVMVIDTGANYTLADLGSCTTPGVPASCKVNYYQNIADSSVALDSFGHGTNVSGIVAGVAPATKLAVINVFGSNAYTSDSLILAAIDWGIANRTALNLVAINMSLGDSVKYISPCSNAATNPYVTPIASAKAAGIVTVVASGNNGYTNGVTMPACTPGTVSVGAVYDANVGSMSFAACTDTTTVADKVACFSNSASFLTILAPGALISSAGYSYAGTSQATPHIAGSVAVLRAAFGSETADQTIARMTGTGTMITDPRNGITKPRINLHAAALPGNDPFASRAPLAGNSGAASGHSILASKEAGEPLHAGNAGGASVWWKWVAPANGQVSLDTHGSNFDTLLAVYGGASVSGLTPVAANDNDSSPNNTSGLLFQAYAGTEYQIAVDGLGGQAGDIQLNFYLNEAAQADLSISQSVTPSSPRVGDSVTYTLTVTNNGPQSATNVVLTDTLPASVNLLSASSSCLIAGPVVTCNLGTLANGASSTVILVANVVTEGSITNSAGVTSDVTDSVAANDTASVLILAAPFGNSDSDIPTLPEWGAILMAMLLMGAAFSRKAERPLA
jgi:uncharacterized repeat protein (TIGR01451 family)